MEKLSFIILTYKSADLLEKCIKSIIKYNKNLNCEFIIINNDSDQKKEIEYIFENIKNTNIINPGYNTYFAGGINIGLQKASGKFVAFINDDGYFEDNSLEIMFNFIKKNSNEYLAVTGNIYNDDKNHTLTTTATKLPSVSAEISRTTFIGRLFKVFNFFPKYYTDYQMLNWNRETKSMDIECGCDAFMIINKEDFIDNGGFYDKLRLYYTEENIGQIAKKIAKKIMYLHNTKMIHNWNYSTNKQPGTKILAITISDRFHYFSKFYGNNIAYIIIFISIIGNPYMLFKVFSIYAWLKKINNDKRLKRG